MSVSIIVPILNEENTIEKLINNLNELEGEFEVIFSDGGSSDKTLSILNSVIKNNYKIVHSQKGRAKQLNNGAKESRYDILLFLHSDSVVEKDVLIKIENFIKTNNAGCLKIKFDSRKILMHICEFFSNLRVSLRHIAFGDQGIFIKKELFNDIGMFDDIALMEDYKLSIKLKKVSPIKAIDSYIISSARRFEKNGVIKTMICMQKLQYMFRNNEDIEKIANIYNNMK